MDDYLKTLRKQMITQSLADKLITNSDIQRAFFEEEIGDGVYDGKIKKDNLKQYVFTKKMINDFVDKIANWVKEVLDYEDKIKILTNKSNKLQINLSNQINKYKTDMSTFANEIEDKEKEIQKLKKENEELKTIISKEQQERKNMANECREILKKTEQNNKHVGESGPQIKKSQIVPTKRQLIGPVKAIKGLLSTNIKYKPRFHNQGNQNNLPVRCLLKKNKNGESRINNNNNYTYIEEIM